MTFTTSAIDDLIKSKNPFAGHIVVRPSQIWGKSFPDVSSINAHASNAVFDAVEKVRQGQRETVGITITAEKGVGKSHIISRIRHRFLVNGGSLFVYMSKYDNLNQIKSQFLQTVASSLRAIGSQKVMQWQEIAAELINEVQKWNYSPQQYISSIYPSLFQKYSTKFVDKLTELVLQNKPEITNPYLVKAILWTLSSTHCTYANYWLSGLELTQAQAEAMGLPNPKTEDREAEALTTVRQIIDIISDYRIPVICFDELDTLEVDDNGFLASQVIASLAKDLYNSLKGGVLVLTMYPETWEKHINALPQAHAVIDRLVSEQHNRRPIELRHLNSDDIVALVRQWLQEFYEENQQTPPHSFYPFNETKLRELGRSKPTVRSVLNWCAENFVIDTVSPPINLVKLCFQSELANVEASIDSLLENEKEISSALWLAFNTLVGETVEKVKIENIQEVKASGSDQGYIDFRIVGNNGKLKIGVDVLQQSGGTYVTAALGKLIDYRKFDLTRGCLVRSKKINPGAKLAKDRLKILLKEKGGEWVLLQAKDIKPLLAISSVYDNCESYQITQQEIFDYIKENKLAINNPLIREILSDPSGQEPDNLTDDELPMRIPQTVTDSIDNIEVD
ncbi:hypothetical protein PI95_028735 [Hassallia byssoidea VB512170]|uniref:Orc1-like AAA ATPase domain-containing protein n=1 Tax=Hassallia byssoidea VB512170 TaxID=1304833 RepID=A0A846HG99_9CYAN|nr:hypothetical protein [Hassalia byssoidea]NEU76392.1 hypothetical protein [Hassalia byssoidea VB512170]